MKITAALTVLAAIILVQAAPQHPSIPRGESITSSSNTQAMEKRAPFVRPNSGISGEHYIQRSDDHHYLRKRTFKSVGTSRSLLLHPSGGVGSEGSGDLRKRRGLSPNSVAKTVKRAGAYNPSDPQGGNREYESGSGYRKRRDPSHSSITKTVKRDGGYDPFNPQSGYGDDLKKRRDLSSSANNISKIVKRGGGYNPSSPQDGESGGHGEGGYGDDLKKRSSTKSDTFRKRERASWIL